MNTFKNLWFLAKSGFLPKKNRNFTETVFLGLKLFGILILLKAICFGIAYSFDYYDIFKFPTNISGQQLREYSPITQLAIVAIVAPILEELAFRIGLLFSKINLTITVIGIIYFALINTSDFERINCIMIALALGLISYLSLNKKNVHLLTKFWTDNRRTIFYGLLLIFGLIHLVNYELTSELLVFSFIVILPRFVAGFIFSFARLSSGIVLAICLHSLNNGIPALILILAQ